MSRYRLVPTGEQSVVLAEHCRHARFVWNLAVEQQLYWQPGRRAPGYDEQCAQLTAARAEHDWLAAGSQTVQQQALRDFAQAMRNFFSGTHGRPTWRKAGVHEGFRQVGLKAQPVEPVNRRFGRVWVPKVGWVRFRLSRPVPDGVKSYRVTRDRAGRWFIAFAHIPDPIAGPGKGSVVGIDRGVAVSAALSTGELLHAPALSRGEATRLTVLQQRLARAQRGSNRRAARPTGGAKTRPQPGHQPQRMGSVGRAFVAQGFRSGRADPGRAHVATMLRVRAHRCRKPQEPSGFRVRGLQHWTVQR